MPLPPKFPQTDVLHTWLQYSNGRTHNKNEQNFRWLAGFQACSTWPEPDLGVTLPRIYASIYFRVTVDIQVRSGLAATKVSFACGCELAAVDRGQESHLLSKITPSYRLKHHPARQGQKTKIKVFCSVWWGFPPPHSLPQFPIIWIKTSFWNFTSKIPVTFHDHISVPGIYRVPHMQWRRQHCMKCAAGWTMEVVIPEVVGLNFNLRRQKFSSGSSYTYFILKTWKEKFGNSHTVIASKSNVWYYSIGITTK